MKTGHNHPCPCGSGKKYKRCCGKFGATSISTIKPFPHPIPPEVLKEIARRKSERIAREVEHGEVKNIITAELDEWRIVASGNKLVYSKTWKVFTDFLNNHLHGLFGLEWGQRQVQLPLEEQHPAVQWRTITALANVGTIPGENGLYMTDIGAANAWFRLAYDLYLIEHNAELQSKLLRRLRDAEKFQGARFEAAVAAMMLASGYELQYREEKGPGKHPEFIATNKKTGQVLAVEAKSRHRPGIMGFRREEDPIPPASFDIDGLLWHAASKGTKEPLLLFVELNTNRAVDAGSHEDVYAELDRAWKALQAREWPERFPAVGVVFYNDASPWYLSTSLPTGLASIWAMVLWPDSSKHVFDAKPLLLRIGQGCLQRTKIPLEFPKRDEEVSPEL